MRKRTGGTEVSGKLYGCRTKRKVPSRSIIWREVKGIFEGMKDRYIFERRPAGIIIPRFRYISEASRRSDCTSGFQYISAWARKKQ